MQSGLGPVTRHEPPTTQVHENAFWPLASKMGRGNCPCHDGEFVSVSIGACCVKGEDANAAMAAVETSVMLTTLPP
jgi:hypothetical protein